MQRDARRVEQLTATRRVEPVVAVAPVCRAAPCGHESGGPQCREVVRDQVRRLADESGELADAPIAPAQLGEEPPPLRVGDELQELEGGRSRCHAIWIPQSGSIYQLGLSY